ncbi:hypothetical protein B0H15DRAFT_852248 [Mycena belliarum]|uniref:Uncharacterized protein n=1 Tax=Mycena belliarum TaxID=1033014 RepID=A0AAD6U2N2_9AGAR|nr:hypothetical protein B0H15DRAFT_852248 [Mycena belliae]
MAVVRPVPNSYMPMYAPTCSILPSSPSLALSFISSLAIALCALFYPIPLYPRRLSTLPPTLDPTRSTSLSPSPLHLDSLLAHSYHFFFRTSPSLFQPFYLIGLRRFTSSSIPSFTFLSPSSSTPSFSPQHTRPAHAWLFPLPCFPPELSMLAPLFLPLRSFPSVPSHPISLTSLLPLHYLVITYALALRPSLLHNRLLPTPSLLSLINLHPPFSLLSAVTHSILRNLRHFPSTLSALRLFRLMLSLSTPSPPPPSLCILPIFLPSSIYAPPATMPPHPSISPHAFLYQTSSASSCPQI